MSMHLPCKDQFATVLFVDHVKSEASFYLTFTSELDLGAVTAVQLLGNTGHHKSPRVNLMLGSQWFLADITDSKEFIEQWARHREYVASRGMNVSLSVTPPTVPAQERT